MIEGWEQNRKPLTKNTVFFDKNPVHGLFNAHRYTELGDYEFGGEVNFIILMRDPYAYCEGVKRRMKEQRLMVRLEDAANFWLECANQQILNFTSAESALCITYEWLCNNPRHAEEVFRDFMPELDDFSLEGEWGVSSIDHKVWETEELCNKNERQILELSPDEIDEISRTLRKDPIAVTYFGYTVR